MRITLFKRKKSSEEIQLLRVARGEERNCGRGLVSLSENFRKGRGKGEETFSKAHIHPPQRQCKLFFRLCARHGVGLTCWQPTSRYSLNSLCLSLSRDKDEMKFREYFTIFISRILRLDFTCSGFLSGKRCALIT